MREILFRGKSELTGEWIYGGIIRMGKDYYIYAVNEYAEEAGMSGKYGDRRSNSMRKRTVPITFYYFYPRDIFLFFIKRFLKPCRIIDITGLYRQKAKHKSWFSHTKPAAERFGYIELLNCMWAYSRGDANDAC